MSTGRVDFKPSDVVLHPVPFVGIMGKSEIEFAAAVLVRVLQLRDDTWNPIAWQHFGSLLASNPNDKILAPWGRNPFFRPDFVALTEAGYSETGPDSLVKDIRIQFTAAGFDALRKYVAKVTSP